MWARRNGSEYSTEQDSLAQYTESHASEDAPYTTLRPESDYDCFSMHATPFWVTGAQKLRLASGMC